MRDALSSDWPAPAAALVLGALWAAWLIGPGLLATDIRQVGGLLTDQAQAVSGYLFYVQDAWRWPLFLTAKLDPPHGLSIVFTDSLPALALLGKLVYTATGTIPNLPVWSMFLGIALMPAAAALALRAAGVAGFWRTLAASAFLMAAPLVYGRIGHLGLMHQWLVVLALHAWLIGRDPERFGRALALGAGIAILAVLVHFYLFVMCLAVLEGLALDLARRGRWTRAATLAAGLPGLGLAVMWAAGYFSLPAGGAATAVGYTFHSMNLAALFTPGFKPPLIPGLTPDATGGQYEGGNYLGLGGVLLAAGALILRPRAVGRALAAHWPLVLVLAGLTAYSLSNVIYCSRNLLASYPLPGFLEGLTGVLRASGRLFWPAYYAILLGVCVLALRAARPAGVCLFAVVCALQFWDMGPLYRTFAAEAARGFAPNARFAAMKDLVRGFGDVQTFLPCQCPGGLPATDTALLQLACSLRNASFNFPYAARVGWPCPEIDYRRPSALREGELFVALAVHFDKLAFYNPNTRFHRDDDRVYACGGPGCPRDRAPFRVELDDSAIKRISLPAAIGLGQANADAERFLAGGWHGVEAQGTWTAGRLSTLVVWLGGDIPGTIRCRMRYFPFAAEEPLRVSVAACGEPVASFEIAEPGDRVAEFAVPGGLAGRDRPLVIDIRVANPKKVNKHFPVADDREVGLYVRGLELSGD